MHLNDLIDIFCIGETKDQINCINWIKKLKVHDILDINRKLFRNFVLICYITRLGDFDSLVIHIMMREPHDLNSLHEVIYSNNVEYLSTIVINERARCEKLYDWENYYKGKDYFFKYSELSINKVEDPTEIVYRPAPDYENEIIEESFRQTDDELDNDNDNDNDNIILDNFHFYQHYYIRFDDDLLTREFTNIYTPVLDSYMLTQLSNIKSGLWFNVHDIRWQYAIRSAILLNCNYDFNILNYSYRRFEFVNIRRFYINGQIYLKDKFVKKANENLVFECDICRCKLDKYSFSNINIGDLCSDCYYNKKLQFKLRLQHLKNLMLLPGKREVFKQNVQKTRNFLKNKNIANLTREKKDIITKNVIRELNKYNQSKEGNFLECPICLDHMNKNDILFGDCGHCFHQKCILKTGSNKCPTCRTTTEFKRLYIQ